MNPAHKIRTQNHIKDNARQALIMLRDSDLISHTQMVNLQRDTDLSVSAYYKEKDTEATAQVEKLNGATRGHGKTTAMNKYKLTGIQDGPTQR